jgi:hydroxymethylglutaryl-CoA reductase (NADPH)
VGTVGGGTGLPTQKEALSIMGLSGGSGGENGDALASILGGVVLAGELSLLASLAEGSLSQSHERLARGRKI